MKLSDQDTQHYLKFITQNKWHDFSKRHTIVRPVNLHQNFHKLVPVNFQLHSLVCCPFLLLCLTLKKKDLYLMCAWSPFLSLCLAMLEQLKLELIDFCLVMLEKLKLGLIGFDLRMGSKLCVSSALFAQCSLGDLVAFIEILDFQCMKWQ